MCEFRIQDCQHSPWKGLPHMAPWHHVGATMEITLDKNGSLYDPAGTESWNVQISMLKIQNNNVSAIVFQNDPKFIGDMISAKKCQEITILSATWFRRKSEEGSDACNTDCGNRVDSKQRSVTAWSTVQTEFCRYKWLIRPLIHRNAIASLDWIGKSAPVPLHWI